MLEVETRREASLQYVMLVNIALVVKPQIRVTNINATLNLM